MFIWQNSKGTIGRSGHERKGIRMETPVAFECHAPSHRVSEGGGPDKLTVHEGKWAFCPYDAKADGHEWAPSGGMPLSMLRHAAMRPKEPAKDRSEV
jgi:hypothetical protein